MTDTEKTEAVVRAIAHEAVALIDHNVVIPHKSSTPASLVAGSALARLARLLDLQLRAGEGEYELLALCAGAAIETWLTGHAALLLGEAAAPLLDERASGGAVSLAQLARRLDDTMYGESEQPKAFRRHLRSFFDEIDVAGSQGTTVWLARYIEDTASPWVKNSPTPSDEPIDFVRVGLWVTLFLAHDYFSAVGEAATAKAARALFDRLRNATDDFYARRRSDGTRFA